MGETKLDHTQFVVKGHPRHGAAFDESGRYRYILERGVGLGEDEILWIMLNPSTADHERDDPTIRRCMNFSYDWGCGLMRVVNLFALRSPSPKALLDPFLPAPVGEYNDEVIVHYAARSDTIVCAWGTHGFRFGRDREVLKLLLPFHDRMYCLGLTQRGFPRHPLYVKKDVLWEQFPQQINEVTK